MPGKPASGRIRIGTSGWTYPHWRGTYYPPELKERERLAHYCTHFESAEANICFYRLPAPRTFAAWYEATPEGFVLSLKAHRFITHRLRLVDAAEPLVNVIQRYTLLQAKMGPVLFQLPPNFACDVDRLRAFLALLPEFLRTVFEFRHASWFVDEVYGLLREHNCALAVADTPKYPVALEETADFVYVRLHGGRVLYRSSYSNDELAAWGMRAQDWAEAGKDVYIYFDNDFMANAPRNALMLRKLLGQVSP